MSYDLKRTIQLQSPDDVALAIRFVVSESLGIGHGRLRAMLCRRIKHLVLTSGQTRQLCDAVGRRLLTGQFSEHFYCQLRMLARIDHAALVYWCRRALDVSTRPYVIRYATRALVFPEKPVLSERWKAGVGAERYPTFPLSNRRSRPRWVPAALAAAKREADAAALVVYVNGWCQRARRWRDQVRDLLQQPIPATDLTLAQRQEVARLANSNPELEAGLIRLWRARAALRTPSVTSTKSGTSSLCSVGHSPKPYQWS